MGCFVLISLECQRRSGNKSGRDWVLLRLRKIMLYLLVCQKAVESGLIELINYSQNAHVVNIHMKSTADQKHVGDMSSATELYTHYMQICDTGANLSDWLLYR